MNCKQCNADIIGDEKFCTVCGTEVVEEKTFSQTEPNQDQNNNNNQNQNQSYNQNQYQGQNQYNNTTSNYNNGSGSSFSNFFKFDKMITPSIIRVVFIVSVVLSALFSLGILITGFGALNYDSSGVLFIMASPFVFIISVFLARIHLELLIVIFKIHETLIEIRNKK